MNPTFSFGAVNMEWRLTQTLADANANNQRLGKANEELLQKYSDAYDQAKEFHGIAEQKATENEALRVEKRKLEDRLQGALNENERLRRVAMQADAKRQKSDAECARANAECAKQALLAQEAQKEASEVRADNESIALRGSYLSDSLQNANARNKSLTQQVLELKGAHDSPKIAGLKAKVARLKEENKKAEADISKLKAAAKKRNAILAEISKLAKNE